MVKQEYNTDLSHTITWLEDVITNVDKKHGKQFFEVIVKLYANAQKQ